MTIKLIATDMDGTFLDAHSCYDEVRFKHILQELKKRSIYFVAASGNPYIQLRTSFKEHADDVVYISENGGYIVEYGHELYHASFNYEDVRHIIHALKDMKDVLCWACTKQQSYTLSSISDVYYEMFLPYFPGVKKVDGFSEIKDDILKFALYLPNHNVDACMQTFQALVSDDVRVVDSGHSCVDLIPANTNKGVAIDFLMRRYGIKKDEVMAFGDAGNDVEMLRHVTYGYAMGNASNYIKEQCHYHAPSNQKQGVLEVIEQYVKDGTFLNIKKVI